MALKEAHEVLPLCVSQHLLDDIVFHTKRVILGMQQFSYERITEPVLLVVRQTVNNEREAIFLFPALHDFVEKGSDLRLFISHVGSY